MTTTVLTRDIAKRVLEIVDSGLVQGLGKPEPGKMCVEAAVCYALGQPHSDQPSCVGRSVRAFKIRLNDARWSSNKARTKGMRRLAIAQLGSDTLDQVEFSRQVTLAVIREILPDTLRRVGLTTHADACASAGDLKEAGKAARDARDAARGKAAYAAAYAAAAYAAAAYAAAYAADAYAADAYAAYADAAADAAAYAAYAAAARDAVLTQAAGIVERILVDMGSQGAQWLDLADVAA